MEKLLTIVKEQSELTYSQEEYVNSITTAMSLDIEDQIRLISNIAKLKTHKNNDMAYVTQARDINNIIELDRYGNIITKDDVSKVIEEANAISVIQEKYKALIERVKVFKNFMIDTNAKVLNVDNKAIEIELDDSAIADVLEKPELFVEFIEKNGSENIELFGIVYKRVMDELDTYNDVFNIIDDITNGWTYKFDGEDDETLVESILYDEEISGKIDRSIISTIVSNIQWHDGFVKDVCDDHDDIHLVDSPLGDRWLVRIS